MSLSLNCFHLFNSVTMSYILGKLFIIIFQFTNSHYDCVLWRIYLVCHMIYFHGPSFHLVLFYTNQILLMSQFFFIFNFYFILFFFKFLFIYLWLCWVFVSVRGLSLVVASGGHSSSRCAGLIIAASLVAEHRLQTRRLSNCSSRAQ